MKFWFAQANKTPIESRNSNLPQARETPLGNRESIKLFRIPALLMFAYCAHIKSLLQVTIL